MIEPLLHQLRRWLRRTGYDVTKFLPRAHPVARRKQLLAHYGVDVVLDVGASNGKYGLELRQDVGYFGRIISFEPMSTEFAQLAKRAAADPKWDAHQFGLGDSASEQQINIAGNSYSSSLLDMLPLHQHAAPESSYVGSETVQIKPLDAVFSQLCQPNETVYLKIDTQGYEAHVLRGAEQSLASINTIQMELSLVPLYAGEILFGEMCQLLAEKQYRLVALEPGFTDPVSGELLQVDGIFHRAGA